MGIPAIVYIHDSRTRELAEYFELPIYVPKDGYVDIEQAYENASWDGFNKNFGEKYDKFEELLIKYGMPPISTNEYILLKDVDDYKLPEYINDYSIYQKVLKKRIFWIGKK